MVHSSHRNGMWTQPHIDDLKRRTFGMLTAADEAIGNITGALKDRMYNRTLIIITTDNGGDTSQGGDIVHLQLLRRDGTNYPLRGGKHT